MKWDEAFADRFFIRRRKAGRTREKIKLHRVHLRRKGRSGLLLGPRPHGSRGYGYELFPVLRAERIRIHVVHTLNIKTGSGFVKAGYCTCRLSSIRSYVDRSSVKSLSGAMKTR